MANISYSLTGTANPDSANIASMSGQPSSRNAYTYTFHGLAGADTFYVAASNAQNGQYANNFSAAKFSIGTTTLNNPLPPGTTPNGTGANSGMYVVSGASNGGTSFTFVLDSVETLVFSDKVVALSYADTTPPTEIASSPTDAATGVAVNSNIFITFSEAVSLGTGSIEIHNSGSGALVASTANSTIIASISGSTLTIDPTVNLAASTSYYVSLTTNSIKDLAGNFLTAVINPHFTTGTTTDTTIPTLSVTTAPVPIAANSNIDISFSEAIALGTGAIEIHNGSATGALVASSATSTIAASISGNMLHLDPVNDLAYNTHYVVTFNGSSVNDLAGNHLASGAVYDFTTVADPYAGATHNIGVDAGPVVVGVGGLGVLAWVLFL